MEDCYPSMMDFVEWLSSKAWLMFFVYPLSLFWSFRALVYSCMLLCALLLTTVTISNLYSSIFFALGPNESV